MELPFSKSYPDFAGSIVIDENLKATVVMDELNATVQLENNEEAEKLISEFEDPNGELGYTEGSVLGKYPELNKFRP